ncbi:MAG: hypothetical protein EOP19_14755 [Hyphomicrobiales bacterium]|nr:MAG: hypothetical protein EOP19_14755 [Hyphomicrobiales bacterium]
MLCHEFSLTLGGPAFKWFGNLRSGSINSFEELQRSFLTRFTDSHERIWESSLAIS